MVWRPRYLSGKSELDGRGGQMRNQSFLFIMFSCTTVVSCGAVNANLDEDEDNGISIGSAEELEDACEELEIAGEEVFEVVFSASTGGCDWGQDGNLDEAQGYLTARSESTVTIELDAGQIGCDLDFEFTDISSDYDPRMYYDDNFVFTFNDVVLASSYARWIPQFDDEDGLAIYDWDAIVGSEVEFSGVPSYCLGRATAWPTV